MTNLKLILSGLLAVVVISCKSDLSPSEYIEEVNTNEDLNKQYEDQTFHIACSYKPVDYITLLQFRNNLDQNRPILPADFISAKKAFQNSSYFILTLGLNDSSDIM